MISSWVVALGIISTSFLGSFHCAAMCGPVASLMSTRRHLLSYNLGRLCGYMLMGALAGSLGQFFLSSSIESLRWISVSLLALILFLLGLTKLFPRHPLWLHRTQKTFKIPVAWAEVFRSQTGFVVGSLTALLPCGWLYTFILAAVATRSAWGGALTLLLFWLGSVPALSALPTLVKKTIRHSNFQQQRIAGFILIFSSLYSLWSFFYLH